MITSKIVDIPTKMEKFYGKGKMLHPSIEEIATLVKTIPQGFVATIDTLSKRLAKDFDVDVTCPMRTGNAIKKIATEYSNTITASQIPFWRVIRSNNLVIKSKRIEFAASQIEKEGFKLIYGKQDAIKLGVTSDKIFTF